MPRLSPFALLLVLSCWARLIAAEAPPLDRQALAQEAVQRDERTWNRIATSDPQDAFGCRWLFAHALVLAETRQHPERLARLFDLATRMQDRDALSRGYGNLKWYWRDPGVTDANAVEFCMQDATVLWLAHRDWIPEPARQTLRELMHYAVDGCLRHRVPTSYTNIAIMNAGNLIVLGETFDRPDAIQEGHRRLDAICLWTWAFGTHEYCSPTYYSPDISGLQFIAALARQPRARRQAQALLEVLWTDLALNWFPAAGKLGGAQSRSYNYLYGLGAIDVHAARAGWLPREAGNLALPGSDLMQAMLNAWPPPERLRELCFQRFPRLVRQSWGMPPTESRTHMLYPDVTLSTASAAYGTQDMPLTVNLAGDRQLVGCYSIPDGREDPYGRKKYATGSAGHMKALHLPCFWAAAQRAGDAVGLAVYRPKDLTLPEDVNLQTHFVFRRQFDGLWLAGQAARIPAGSKKEAGRLAVAPDAAIVFRWGTAGVGIRVLAARAQDGRPASVALVDDGNSYGALRLTIEHRAESPSVEAAAALWVRVGSGLNSDQAFHAWRKQFEQARPKQVRLDDQQACLEVPGTDGPVLVSATAPFGVGAVALLPAPCRGVLELDGQEIGRALLESAEPLASLPADRAPRRPLVVPAARSVAWEAEDGFGFPPLVVGEDPKASARRYLWQPEGDKRSFGAVLWPLEVEKPGRYYLSARTLAADTESDSFFVRILGGAGSPAPQAEWHLRRAPDWQWQPFMANRGNKPSPLELPAGRCWLEIRPREAGAKLDRLFLSSDAKQPPE